MAARLVSVIALIGGATASVDVARGGALPVLRFRGGASTYPAPVRYNYESMRVTTPQPQPIVEEPTMSDAERVYVTQQFEKPQVRLAFLRKVYSLVFSQLVLTAAIIYALRTVPGLLPGIMQRLGMSVGLLPIVPLLLLGFTSSGQGATSPLAYFLLLAFTCFEGLAVGAITWAFPTALIMKAAGATAIATGGLTTYALTTKRDFTASTGILFSALLGITFLGLLQLFLGGDLLMTMRISLGLVVFCAYLVVNTQMMMGGNKKRQLRPNEHIMAAVTIYTDIIQIFLHVLASMARSQND